MRRGALVALCLVGGCALDESGLSNGGGKDASLDVGTKDVTILDVLGSDAPDDVVAADVPPDVPPPPCNPTAPFGSITDLGPGVDTGAFESSPSLTSDELTIYFARDAGGNRLGLFYATRASTSQAFGNATELSLSTNQTYDSAPFIVDGLKSLYFASARNGSSHYHLYQAAGNGTLDGWSTPTAMTALNTFDPGADTQPWIASTGEAWFASDRLGTLDLYVAASTTSTPSVVTSLSTGYDEVHPTLSQDALTIFFGRTDAQAHVHVWTATRSSTSTAFASPTAETEFDSGTSNNAPGWLSVDGCRMYFTSDRGGGKGSSDIWMATRP